jgi:hypothetical protein
MRILFAERPADLSPESPIEYRLFKCADKYYPTGKRSVIRAVKFNGKKAEIAVTFSGGYATKETSGSNGYIRFEGKVFWFSFPNGFDVLKAVPVGTNFLVDEGTAAAPPVRIPADEKGEALRRKNLSEALIAKKNKEAGIVPETASETPAE